MVQFPMPTLSRRDLLRAAGAALSRPASSAVSPRPNIIVVLLDGRWTGTWTPAAASSGRVEIRIHATNADSSLTGDVQRSGNLQ